MPDIHHRLIDLLLSGGGLNEVAAELAVVVGRPVLIANAVGERLAGELPPVPQERFAEALRQRAREERYARQLPPARPPIQLGLVPLVVQNEVEGWLVVEASEPDDAGVLTLEQGATVVALALIKHRAVQEAEQRLRRELLEDMLTSERWSVGRLAEQAQSLGWQLDSKPVVILFDFSEARRYALAGRSPDPSRLHRIRERFLKIIRQVTAEHSPLSIVVERSDGFAILPHLPGLEMTQAREHARSLVEALARQVRQEGLGFGYAVAGGGFYGGIEGLRRSFREAQQALEIGTRLTMRRPIWFDEVQVYLLLEAFARSDEARDWFAHALGPLLEYDRRNRTQLTQTMEVYFDTNQSLQQAAQVLHVHPNTLKYRLQRIKQVLAQDPFAGENQLQFYLAAKMAQLLR